MRAVIALIVIIYLVGVGVVLSPTIQAKWNGASASNLAASIGQALPNALAWHGDDATTFSELARCGFHLIDMRGETWMMHRE